MRNLRLWLCRKLCPKGWRVSADKVIDRGTIDAIHQHRLQQERYRNAEQRIPPPHYPGRSYRTNSISLYPGHEKRGGGDHPMGSPHDLLKSAVENGDHIQVMGESVDPSRITFDKGICYVDGAPYMDWIKQDDNTHA